MTRIAYATVFGALLAYFLLTNVALSGVRRIPSVSVNGPNAAPVELATTTDASYNWAGYVAQDGTYTGVSATWTVPMAVYPSGSHGIAGDATWVGIGGVSATDLIQAGTQTLVDSTGATRYVAWYETLPNVAEPVDLDVEPGDSITVAVTYVGNSQWHISFVNQSSHEQASADVPYGSSFSSAEWIEEKPSLAVGESGRASMALDSFDRVTFTGASTVKNGVAQTISQSGAQALRMQGALGLPLATPSVVTDSGFSVVRADPVAMVTVPPRMRMHIIIVGQE